MDKNWPSKITPLFGHVNRLKEGLISATLLSADGSLIHCLQIVICDLTTTKLVLFLYFELIFLRIL